MDRRDQTRKFHGMSSREASPFWNEYIPAEQALAVRWRTESDYTLKFHEDSTLTSSKPVHAFLLLSISLSTSKVTGLRRCRFWGLSGSLMRPKNLHFNKPCSGILRYCQLRTPSTPPSATSSSAFLLQHPKIGFSFPAHW